MRTEIFSQPATTNQLSTPTARKPPDQRALNYAETRLATGCFPQSPTIRYCCCAHADLPFQDREQAEATAVWLRIAD